MGTLNEYFENEAGEYMAQLERVLQRKPLPDGEELRRAARALRGTARMAREERVFRAAGVLEAAARALAANALPWSDAVVAQVHATIADLRALVGADGDDAGRDARVEAISARWRELGIEAPAGAVDGAAAGADAAIRREFRQFAAREVAGIVQALDDGIDRLGADPMDRDPLRTILRRQRALLGAARLDEIPVVAEVLRAIEDLTRVVAKLDIGVKREWLDVYRVARDGLNGAIEPLQRFEDPQPSHALSRLRHMREELIDRYGTGEEVSAADATGALVQPTQIYDPPGTAEQTAPAPPAEPPAPTAEPSESAEAAVDDVVPIDELCYRGTAALSRALELRDAVSRVVAHDPQARAAVDEVFDLIRLARD